MSILLIRCQGEAIYIAARRHSTPVARLHAVRSADTEQTKGPGITRIAATQIARRAGSSPAPAPTT